MNAGLLDRPIKIELRTSGRDEFGGEQITWVAADGDGQWARKQQPSGGSENQGASQNQHRIDYVLTIHFMEGLTPATAFKYRVTDLETEEVMDIRAVSELGGRRAYLQLAVTVRPEEDTAPAPAP